MSSSEKGTHPNATVTNHVRGLVHRGASCSRNNRFHRWCREQITLTRTDTSVELRAISDNQGNYQFLVLRAGTYLLRAEQSGFQKLQREGIVVNTTERLRVDLALVRRQSVNTQ